jgi:hypothetical protein
MAVPMQQLYAVDLLACENQKIRRRYRCALASGAVSQVNCSSPNLRSDLKSMEHPCEGGELTTLPNVAI